MSALDESLAQLHQQLAQFTHETYKAVEADPEKTVEEHWEALQVVKRHPEVSKQDFFFLVRDYKERAAIAKQRKEREEALVGRQERLAATVFEQIKAYPGRTKFELWEKNPDVGLDEVTEALALLESRSMVDHELTYSGETSYFQIGHGISSSVAQLTGDHRLSLRRMMLELERVSKLVEEIAASTGLGFAGVPKPGRQ